MYDVIVLVQPVEELVEVLRERTRDAGIVDYNTCIYVCVYIYIYTHT